MSDVYKLRRLVDEVRKKMNEDAENDLKDILKKDYSTFVKELGDNINDPKFLDAIINTEKRYELLICFNRVRREFRNEKLLILFILNFIFLSSELCLENISFM